MDILHAKIQKRQQNDDSLLLIPRNVVGDGQVVDIVQTENFLELQSNDSQRIRIVALPGVQNTRNAVDVAQRQFVVLVFRASGCQDHSIFRQCLGKFGIVFPALGTAVTARHHNELFDRAAFYRIDHLIRQSQNLRVCKSADQLSCFNFSRCSASFCVFNDNGKILLLPDFSWDMGTSRISCCASSVESVFVAVFRRHDAVGRHQDRTVEGFKFLLLLPPRIAVVADKVGILFECRVIVGREHLGMGINIHAGSRCLLQQHFQIPQVVTGNQNTGICPNANIYLRNFGISIGFRVGLVQQSHTGYAVFSGFHCQSNQFFYAEIVIQCSCQRPLKEGIDLLIILQ
ncbi:hypothetical protein IMSAGC015_02178 [Lachnospiraceae bacterium]|nr:hypothetical protein IMSAGC015_02178 [Lachnospiraceae bacterium]